MKDGFTNQKFVSIKRAVSNILANMEVPCFNISNIFDSSILNRGVYFSFHLRGIFPFAEFVPKTTDAALEIFFHNATIRRAFEACLNENSLNGTICKVFLKALSSSGHLSEYVPLYIATDIKNFTQTPEYFRLSKSFKTILNLDNILTPNIKDSIQKCLNIQQLNRPIPISILYPFLDQLIAARSLIFVGSRKSTFSQMIHRIHLASIEDSLVDTST